MRAANDPRVQLLAELADETRYAVLERLEQGPASASELAERLGVSPTRLANHLRRLRDAGLVAVSHQGRLALYELAEPGLREIFSMLNGLRGAPPRTGQPALAATQPFWRREAASWPLAEAGPAQGALARRIASRQRARPVVEPGIV